MFFREIMMNIKHKLWMIIGFFIFGFCVLGLSQIWYQSQSLINERIKDSKNIVDMASIVLTNCIDLDHALEIIQNFPKNHVYIFVMDDKGVMKIHPNKELINKNMMNVSDKKGFFLFQEFYKTNSSGDLISYYWPNPKTNEIEYKRTFVIKNEKYGWVIGSGVYYVDIYMEK